MRPYSEFKQKFVSYIDHLLLETPADVTQFLEQLTNYGFIAGHYYPQEFQADVNRYRLRGFSESEYLRLIDSITLHLPQVQIITKDKKTYKKKFHNPNEYLQAHELPTGEFFLYLGYLLINQNQELFQLVHTLLKKKL